MVSMWKSQEGYVALVLSVYLYVGSRHSTHIARFVWQAPLFMQPSCRLPYSRCSYVGAWLQQPGNVESVPSLLLGTGTVVMVCYNCADQPAALEEGPCPLPQPCSSALRVFPALRRWLSKSVIYLSCFRRIPKCCSVKLCAACCRWQMCTAARLAFLKGQSPW